MIVLIALLCIIFVSRPWSSTTKSGEDSASTSTPTSSSNHPTSFVTLVAIRSVARRTTACLIRVAGCPDVLLILHLVYESGNSTRMNI